MGLFIKKQMDQEAGKAFWEWFSKQEEWIKENIDTNGMDVVWAIDEKLKPVFPYFKKELEFQLGYNDGIGEFFFFHFNNKTLKTDGEILKELMPKDLSERWNFILDA